MIPAKVSLASNRFVLLFCSLFTFLLSVPVEQEIRQALHSETPAFLEAVTFLAVLATAAFSIAERRTWRLGAVIVAVPTIVLWSLHVFVGSVVLEILCFTFGVGFLGYVITLVLVFVFSRQHVSVNTLCAALCVYLLLGVLWALAYSAIAWLDPSAFTSSVSGGKSRVALQIGRGDSTAVLYFSLTSMTSLGSGNILPMTPSSRMLAALEAIVGQLYLTVLVARLVGLHIAESLRQDRDQDNTA
jgi:hypothetical protein